MPEKIPDNGQGGRVVVRIDKDIEGLVPDYCEMTARDAESIRAALVLGDYETISRLGHNLKGSGGGYGFDGITEIGREIEQHAKNRSGDDIRRLADELSSYLERLHIIYE